MSRKTYEATGATVDGTTIVLDIPLPLRGRVRVQVEPENRAAKRESVLESIRALASARESAPVARGD